jgi:hypothetical protein
MYVLLNIYQNKYSKLKYKIIKNKN